MSWSRFLSVRFVKLRQHTSVYDDKEFYFALSGLNAVEGDLIQGRRAPLRFALAPGYHISRLWRCGSRAALVEEMR